MADVIRYGFYLPKANSGAHLIDIYQREVGKTKRYMAIPKTAITEDQAIGICQIINNGGNIDINCSYSVKPDNYEFDWKVKESLKRAEAQVYDKIQPYVKNTNGLSPAAPPAAASTTQAPAAATKQQGPRTFILPITGTKIEEAKKEPKRFFFELPFYDQDDYDELLDDFILGTSFPLWDSNVDNSANLAGFTFKEKVNDTTNQLEEDLATLDKLIEEYLKKYLAQKNAPAVAQAAPVAQPAAADMSGVQFGDPYFLLPATQCQVYSDVIFNVPAYYIFITGQEDQTSMVVSVMDFLNKSKFVTKNTPTTIKVKQNPSLIRIQFDLVTQNLDEQEIFFQGLDYILSANGYVKPYKDSSMAQAMAVKVDAVIDIEAQVDKLKTELDQLVFLRSLNSELDFEKNIEIGQKIAKVKENINELNFSKLQAKLSTDDIFDQLFEQSFTPIQHVYTNLKVTQGEEGDFFTPNGKPSELSEQLNELIRTQQFKDWFGDWQLTYMYKQAGDTDTDCSVVLTENFEPKLFYHGTGQEFSYFKFDKFPAAYFAANQAYSQWFANLHGGDKGYTIPFFLNVRNPLDLTQFGTEEIRPKDFFDYMYLQTGFDAEQLEVNPLFLNPSAPARECWVYLRNNPKMLKKLADNQVYDGIHFYETNPGVDKGLPAYKTEVYITFKAEQCKIADNDRGLILMASLKSFLLEKGGKI
jgi:hypothetical protein